MGFYPVDPVSGDYVFGAPQFKYVKLSLPNGNSLEIKANNLSKENLYVKAIRLNGKSLKGRTISYKEVMQGGILEYDMTSEPIKK
jgi:putative alpha-1,2-mannosidase